MRDILPYTPEIAIRIEFQYSCRTVAGECEEFWLGVLRLKDLIRFRRCRIRRSADA